MDYISFLATDHEDSYGGFFMAETKRGQVSLTMMLPISSRFIFVSRVMTVLFSATHSILLKQSNSLITAILTGSYIVTGYSMTMAK
jgi:hypothetical protein